MILVSCAKTEDAKRTFVQPADPQQAGPVMPVQPVEPAVRQRSSIADLNLGERSFDALKDTTYNAYCRFYIIGWSRNGKFAYADTGTTENFGAPTTATITILDLVTDEAVWSVSETDPQDYYYSYNESYWNVPRLVQAHREEIDRALEQYGIEFTPVSFQKLPVTEADVAFFVDDAFPPPDNVLDSEHSIFALKRGTSMKKELAHITGERGLGEFLGYLKSPFENRIVLFSSWIGLVESPWSVRINGCHLDSGFEDMPWHYRLKDRTVTIARDMTEVYASRRTVIPLYPPHDFYGWDDEVYDVPAAITLKVDAYISQGNDVSFYLITDHREREAFMNGDHFYYEAKAESTGKFSFEGQFERHKPYYLAVYDSHLGILHAAKSKLLYEVTSTYQERVRVDD